MAENKDVMVVDATALELITKAELDTQVATAKKWPRDLAKFTETLKAWLTKDRALAGKCFYRLERKDKQTGQTKAIEGPSVRLAELALHLFGNARAGSRVIDDTGEAVVCQGVAIDLEQNVAVSMEVRRRITYATGQRYSQDMVNTTANAGCAIAFRNAMFKVIPGVLIQDAFETAKKVAGGQQKDVPTRFKEAVKLFKDTYGVSKEQLLTKLGKKEGALVPDDITALLGIYNALHDGDTTVAEAFSVGKPETMAPEATSEPARCSTQASAGAPEPAGQVADPRATLGVGHLQAIENVIHGLRLKPSQVSEVLATFNLDENGVARLQVSQYESFITALRKKAGLD